MRGGPLLNTLNNLSHCGIVCGVIQQEYDCPMLAYSTDERMVGTLAPVAWVCLGTGPHA